MISKRHPELAEHRYWGGVLGCVRDYHRVCMVLVLFMNSGGGGAPAQVFQFTWISSCGAAGNTNDRVKAKPTGLTSHECRTPNLLSF